MQQLLVRPENMKRIDSPELAKAYIDEQVAAIQEQVGDGKVLLALSGGVDSSVVAALLIKAIGDRLVAVHVNHGLLRKGEPEQVIEVFRNQMHANLISMWTPRTGSWTSWRASATRRPSGRSSARSSSTCSPRRPGS